MNIFRLAIELFALYILYKIIFDFIIPIAKTTKEVKKQFNDINTQMKEKMNQQENAQQNATNNFTSSNSSAAAKNDDYIEFEEIK